MLTSKFDIKDKLNDKNEPTKPELNSNKSQQ